MLVNIKDCLAPVPPPVAPVTAKIMRLQPHENLLDWLHHQKKLGQKKTPYLY
jgi:hypothetical protein